MLLVVDTNILFSFFRDNPVRFIIINSDLLELKLFTSSYNLEELRNNKPDIIKYSKLRSEQIEFAIEELIKHLSVVSPDECKEFKSEAKNLIHDKDILIFALALKLKCPIWSNEPRFKEQSSVKIFNTRELKEFLEIT